MRTVAAIPAIGLLAGAAFGLLAPDSQLVVGYVVLSTCAAAAMFAWHRSWSDALAIATAAAEAMLFPIGAMVFSRVTFAGLCQEGTRGRVYERRFR